MAKLGPYALNTIIVGDCLEVLRQIPDGVFQCSVCSPPYWGLRFYGIPAVVWGGDPLCEHEWDVPGTIHTGGIQKDQHGGQRVGRDFSAQNAVRDRTTGQFCQKCGAWLGSLGLEPTPELYVEHIVEVFREVRRVLRDDGTLWLNMGDSYIGSPPGTRGRHGQGKEGDGLYKRYWDRQLSHGEDKRSIYKQPPGLKQKDLAGIPWSVAFALRTDGWWLRSDIIWHKPNCMPESVRDRPTKSHEYVFLMSKSKRYYYDQDAIREPQQESSLKRAKYSMGRFPKADGVDRAVVNYFNPKSETATRESTLAGLGRNKRTVWTIPEERDEWDEIVARVMALDSEQLDELAQWLEVKIRLVPQQKGTVWKIPTHPFPQAHFATFPPKLVEPMIKAGTSERGACPECGKAWVRVTGRKFILQQDVSAAKGIRGYNGTKKQPFDGWDGFPRGTTHSRTIGWRPACSCYDYLYQTQFPKARSPRKRHQHDLSGSWWGRVKKRPGLPHWQVVPCIVLDPFAGAGTTLMVADGRGHDWLGIDINPDYAVMSQERIKGDRKKRAQLELFS